MHKKKVVDLRRFLKNAEKLVDMWQNMPVHSGPELFARECVKASTFLAEVLLFKRPKVSPTLLREFPSIHESEELALVKSTRGVGMFAHTSRFWATRPTLWGKALGRNNCIETAPAFCISLEECGAVTIDKYGYVAPGSVSSKQEEKWLRKYKTQEAAFREASIKLSRELRDKILDRLSECDPKGEYLVVRYDVLRARLKAFRDTFICSALVGWPCRESEIPKEVTPPCGSDAQIGRSGVLKIQQDIKQHKCWFSSRIGSSLDPPEKPEWTFDNEGLERYRELLSKTWDRETGKMHFCPSSEPAKWIISVKNAQKLKQLAKKISELAVPLQGLSESNKKIAGFVLGVIREDDSPWGPRPVCWSFVSNLERVIAKLEQAQAAAEELIQAASSPAVPVAGDEEQAEAATKKSQADSVTPEASKPATAFSGGETVSERIEEPKKEAAQAYKLYYGLGYSQTKVAKIMTNELKRPVSQGQVSKWVNQYKRWAQANNIPITPKPKIINLDHRKLEMKKRTDGRISGDARHKARRDDDE